MTTTVPRLRRMLDELGDGIPRPLGGRRDADDRAGACAAMTASAVDLPSRGRRPRAVRDRAIRTPDRALPLPLGLVGEAEHQHAAPARPAAGRRARCEPAAPAATAGGAAGRLCRR